MLTFRNTSRVYLVLLTLSAALSLIWPGGYVMLLVLTLAYAVLLVFGSVFVSSGFYMASFCRGNGNRKHIALSFDDGPDPTVTPMVLDVLKEKDIHAAFFCIGEKVEKYPELTARIVSEGHLAGNHSWSHSVFFDLIGSRRMTEDIQKASEALEAATGTKPEWFRPPYGVTNPPLAKAVTAMKLKTMGWSVRSFDASRKSPEKILERIRRKWHPGAIILLHDTHPDSPELVRMIIKEAEKRGYGIVRADGL